jgi:hypothetical protein
MAISQRLPLTTSELLSIKGCGEYKVSAYGNQTLEVVRAYLKNHPEARPLSEPLSKHMVLGQYIQKAKGENKKR